MDKRKVEKCVSCGADTEYTVDTDIHERKYYVEGAGQLCKLCYIIIYEETKD